MRTSIPTEPFHVGAIETSLWSMRNMYRYKQSDRMEPTENGQSSTQHVGCASSIEHWLPLAALPVTVIVMQPECIGTCAWSAPLWRCLAWRLCPPGCLGLCLCLCRVPAFLRPSSPAHWPSLSLCSSSARHDGRVWILVNLNTKNLVTTFPGHLLLFPRLLLCISASAATSNPHHQPSLV